MRSAIEKFLRDDSGAAAMEYGLLAALISVAAVTALTDVGDSLSAMFGSVASDIDSATAP